MPSGPVPHGTRHDISIAGRRAVDAALEAFAFVSNERQDHWRRLRNETVAEAEQRFDPARPCSAGDLEELAESLVALAVELSADDGVRRPHQPTSYVDAGRAAVLLKEIIAYVHEHRCADADDLPSFVRSLTDTQPTDRHLLLVLGRLRLENGDVEGAIATGRRLLSIQAVCPHAQRLLLDALNTHRDHGEDVDGSEIALDDLSDRFCPVPFTTLVTGYRGQTFLCDCPAYVPYSTGNALTGTSAEALWNSPMAQEIRRSILDGDFSHCSRSLCGLIREGKLARRSDVRDPTLRDIIEKRKTKLDHGPSTVQLSHDQTCNLACPSCRNEILSLKRPEQEVYARSLDRIVLPLLRRTQGLVTISGGGDPFASRYYRSILSALEPEEYPGLRICLLTNGLLLDESQWMAFEPAHPMIEHLFVSIDAATAETYETVRRPGKWDRLRPNLEFLAERRCAGDFAFFGLCFVVQALNFREMPGFVELGHRLGVDVIWFQRLVNFGSFTGAEMLHHDVASPLHPEHREYLEVLEHPRLSDPIVCLYADLQMRISVPQAQAHGRAIAPPPRRYQTPRILAPRRGRDRTRTAEIDGARSVRAP